MSIRELLKSSAFDQIVEAKSRLCAMPPAQIESELTELSRDGDPGVRAYSIIIAGELFKDQVERLALPLLDDPVAFVRWHACELLHFNQSRKACDKILSLLVNDDDRLVRSRAAWALGDLGNPELITQMSQAAESETATNHVGTPIRDVIFESIEEIRQRYDADMS